MNDRWLLLLLIPLIWASNPATPAMAQVMEHGYVLLANDRYLDGRVETIADRYVITKTEGNQVSVPRNQVQFLGSSRQELYQYKRRSLPPSARAGDHYKLAHWCLTAQLLPEAGQHYLTLIKTNPPHTSPAVKRLGVEIKDAMLQQPEFRAYLGMAPLARPQQSVARTATSSSVVTASTDAPFPAALLSTQVKALFAEQVQHVLMNRCGQANCHGHAGSTAFRLEPVAGVDAALKSQKNLEAVLGYVSHSPAAQSTLMEYATKPHGNRGTPPIAPRESHLVQDLDRWIHFVRNQVVTADASSVSSPFGLRPVLPGAAEYRPVPGPPSRGNQDPGSQQSESNNRIFSIDFPVGVDPPAAQEIDALDAMITEQIGFPPLSTNNQSQDPFDPSEFNRKRTANTVQDNNINDKQSFNWK